MIPPPSAGPSQGVADGATALRLPADRHHGGPRPDPAWSGSPCLPGRHARPADVAVLLASGGSRAGRRALDQADLSEIPRRSLFGLQPLPAAQRERAEGHRCLAKGRGPAQAALEDRGHAGTRLPDPLRPGLLTLDQAVAPPGPLWPTSGRRRAGARWPGGGRRWISRRIWIWFGNW
ncbi:hypothetical protein ACRAWD_19095 [Caulobacter segnis]